MRSIIFILISVASVFLLSSSAMLGFFFYMGSFSPPISVSVPRSNNGEDNFPQHDGALFKMEGESSLAWGTRPIPLLLSPERILRVYGYDENGVVVDYFFGSDWLFSQGALVRSPGSAIPDFGNYAYLSGPACSISPFSRSCIVGLLQCLAAFDTARCRPSSDQRSFAFSATPRNPPLTIPYTIYVDYETRVDSRKVQSTVMPLRQDPAALSRVLCIGDSIAAGSHTISHYFRGDDSDSWCGLLRSFFAGEVEFLNLTLPGGEVKYLVENLPAFTAQHPDMVLISIGMNDHTRGMDNLEHFGDKLGIVVQAFLDDGVTPVLIGFFQRNTGWLNEDPRDTRLFNDAIRTIASRFGVPFVDIYSVFDQIYPTPNDIAIFTGDFMHHPNNFGHRIYASAILPSLLNEKISVTDIPFYVHLKTLFFQESD